MSTYIFSRLEYLQKRFDEIELILNYASENESRLELYTSLCRSSQVLLTAHFEGAVKEFIRDALDDFNHSEYKFIDSPAALKATFCSSFLPENTDQKLKFPTKLLDMFNTLPVKYDADAFLPNNHGVLSRNYFALTMLVAIPYLL